MIHLAIFAKFWEAGKVKTRLAKRIGPEAARDVYFLFLKHLTNKFSGFGDRRTVVFTPSDRENDFRLEMPKTWNLTTQASGDLGTRMKTFFHQFASDPTSVNILIGSDTPDLPEAYLRQTAELLERVPVVIGPSGDGGYYLIACRGPAPSIFDGIAWSTNDVLPSTIEKLKQQGCSFELLPQLKDVDEADDLQRLLAELKTSGNDAELLEQLQQLELPFG